MLKFIRVACLLPVGLIVLTSPTVAQIRLGETSTSASGTLSTGYSATYGNMAGSTHGWTVGGSGTFTGFFHSPNFLSYNFSPYLNQSSSNSNFQSISNASGFNLSANIFGGSSFPGSVMYSKGYNSEGNYAVPGLANYVTHGNSDAFGVTWSEQIPDKPTFSAGYQMGGSQYSVYGTNDSGSNSFRSLNLHSGYKWAGFNMGAYYTAGDGHSTIPQVVAGETLETDSSNSAYGLNLSHLIPLGGSVSASLNRSNWDTDYLGTGSHGSIDTINTTASVHPTEKLSVTTSANYSDNLTGQLIQSVISAGGVVPGLNTNESSDSMDVMTVGTYAPLRNMQTSAFYEYRSQDFLGETYSLTSYGGSGTYTHSLLNGIINGAISVSANSANQNGEDSIGFSATENYSNVILGWHVNESFSYAQNVQTLLVTYMNSFYNYSGNARHRWGLFNVSVGGGGARTALTQQAGTANSSQSYNANLGYSSWLTATGSYSKSDGQALLTGSGLVGVPIPSPVLPSDLVSLFGGKSYSFSLSSSPVKKLIIEASYGRSTNNTFTNGVSSANENSQFNSLIQYQVRKLNFVSGYSRLQQGFSSTGTQPEIVSSYYMGISRWFNFF